LNSGIANILNQFGKRLMSDSATKASMIGGAESGGPAAAVSKGFKDTCRRAVASVLYHTRLLHIVRRLESSHQLCFVPGTRWPKLRRFAGSKYGILCYHRVGTEGVPLFSRLEPRVFAAQMRFLKKHYRIVPLAQLCSELREAHLVKPTVAITFDDGYRDLYTHAFPVLQKYQIPATIYLIGRSMETGEVPWYDRIFAALSAAEGSSLEVGLGSSRRFKLSSRAARAAAAWEIVCYLRSIPDSERRVWCADFETRAPAPERELQDRMLNWKQVREMQRGGVDFGAHTMTHPSVSRLSPSVMENELKSSRQVLEQGLETYVQDFAFPFGKPSDCGAVAEEYLLRYGYRSAVTTTAGTNMIGSNLMALRRLQIGDDPSIPSFAFGIGRLFLEGELESSADTSGTLSNGIQKAESRGEIY
jgi:peptidoglycan/xylan/chitin deacetylase (PgdA/CDA1 family)